MEFGSTYRELESIKNNVAGKLYLYLDDFERDINHTVILIERFNITLSQNYNEIVSRGKNISSFEQSKKCSLGFCENLTGDACIDLNNILSKYENITYEVPDGFSLPEGGYYLVDGSSVKILVSNESKEYYNRYCLNDTNTSLFPLDINDIQLVDILDRGNITREEPIKSELAENLPMCCVYRQCSPCCADEECKNDASLFPVMFIHGHSLLRGPTPEPLLDVFNKVQYQLQDDGYINAGTIYYDLIDYKKDEWGLSRFPITVKASYYYDYFYSLSNYVYITRSTENIDTYAVRLNDMVKILKYKTGKPKANIIAHSMGGLVVRRYMQIFGDDSVNKVILIATPNKGIGDSIKRFCGIFGEKKECEDMYKDSVLIKKLNDPNYRPSGASVYTISGIGCRTEDSDGDGVVTLQSSQLDYAVPYVVNGTCSDILKKEFHKEVLDIDKYPKTYEYIKRILEESG